MRVRRCDRCGEVYDNYVGNNTVGRCEFNMDDEQTNTEEYFDLCPKCNKELESWLNAHKKSKGVV